ncbi:PHD finger protein 21A-like isoform X1 [Tribolium madens]|uniref:PHD finger protein 21A-like isoform X1 n=1 Tax=Tribolium madens TaxID=41895 RepID=UPI001CF75F82|nr:PHD finger protein 21A-like isoform X1 [Tribolium madens]
MKDLEISKGLKGEIETNQNQLKNAIRNHQSFVIRLKQDPDNVDLQKEINKAEQEIILVGIAQKSLLERLREEYKAHQKSLKTNITKTSIEERRFNLSTALNRARKQNIVSRPTSISVSSISDDSVEAASVNSSPEHHTYNPVDPHEITQPEFLNNFGLVTHDVYKEMQNKRVERKRRSTANPHFLYGNKGWDFQPKRKRNSYLYSSISPPNTRQAVRKKNERVSPPPTNGNAKLPFPQIPNLPSGLTIERVSPSSSSPDSKTCVTCRQPGLLTTCESCTNGFHVRCHNRPLAQSPRQCPRCINKEVRTVGSLNVPSGMSVSYVTPSEVAEKLEEKKKLEKVNKTLSAELTQLQDRHSQLTISLKRQKSQQEELLMTQQTTEEKIKQILTFISNVKNEIVSKPTQSQAQT